MKDTTVTQQTALHHDTSATLKNRGKLLTNVNLLFWYRRLYEHQFEGIQDIHSKKILEVGSGTSPLKLFYSNVKSSDVMKLDYLDYVFDAHEIDNFVQIEDNSLDIITVCNVLHHLRNPVLFLAKASKKLKPGGSIIFTEPYFSVLSRLIYVYLHPEPVNVTITKPELDDIKGPLSSANIALPYLIFENKWDIQLHDIYDYCTEKKRYFSGMSYLLTGGISKRFSLPTLLYKLLFRVDMACSEICPKFTAAFFTLRLIRKQDSC